MNHDLPVVLYCFKGHVDNLHDHYGNPMDYMQRNRDNIGMCVFENAHLKPSGAYDPSEPNARVYYDLGSDLIFRISDIQRMAADFMKRGAHCWAALFYAVLANFYAGASQEYINEKDHVVLMYYTTSAEDVEVLGY